MRATNGMLDPDDSVILLIDHQSGLFNTVRDLPVPDLRNYVIAIAKAATLLNIPVITTASVPDGPNGPLIPEIHHFAPHAVYVPRTGQINTWDNPRFVDEIKKTGRKTLIIAGTLTSVCMTFPAVSARKEGYNVYCVVDASGNWNEVDILAVSNKILGFDTNLNPTMITPASYPIYFDFYAITNTSGSEILYNPTNMRT